MIQALIMPWIMARLWKLAAAGVAATVIVGSCVARDHGLKRKGAQEAVRKIEKANDNAAKLGSDAARKSRSDGVRGPIDPTTRND